MPAPLDALRLAYNRLSAMTTITFGVPGLFQPRIPPPWLAPEGTAAALSLYDTSPLRAMVAENPDTVYLSARTGDGLPYLLEKIACVLEREERRRSVREWEEPRASRAL